MRQHRGSTKRKLEEAAFFLGFLGPNYMKERKFDFYLSAFISAARSVTWVMKSEYGKLPGWESWFNAQKPDSDEAQLLSGTTKLRNRLTKQEALRTTSRIRLMGMNLPTHQIKQVSTALKGGAGYTSRLSGSNGKYTLEVEVDGEKLLLPATGVHFERRLTEFPDANILELCAKYYDWLASLVHQCEKQFDA